MSDGCPPAAADSRAEIIRRRVNSRRDVFRWERSEAFADVVTFVDHVNEVTKRPAAAVAGTRVCGAGRPPPGTSEVNEVLGNVRDWAARHEPARNDFTVGPSFGKFHELLHRSGYDLLVETYGRRRPGDCRTVELPVYLENSFGDPDAKTYGLDNELSFCMFLIALFKLHHLTRADEPFIVPVLFAKYMDIVDYLMNVYRLEPTAKYGSSALDDYRFVAFLWGSAQLAAAGVDDEQHGLTPAVAITDTDVALRHQHGHRYMFVKCVDAVHRRWAAATGRNGPQRPVWCRSYQLWNLTAFRRWDRVNGCLMAAFLRDVLGRFEVVRRLAFGELLSIRRNPRPAGVWFYDCIPAAVVVPAVAVMPAAALTTSDRAVEGCGDERESVEGVWDEPFSLRCEAEGLD